jgi:multiple sugar transport system permease protein
MRIHRKKLSIYLFVLPTVALLLGIAIFPLGYSLSLSFFHWDLRLGTGWIFAGLKNYGEAILRDERFHRSLMNTFKIGALAISVEFCLGMFLALLLNRILRARRIITTLLVIPVMRPPIVAGLIWRMLYHPKYGAINAILHSLGVKSTLTWLSNPKLAILAIVITDAWQWVPFVMMILLAGLQSIPVEPFESARVDGASRLQLFRYITLPLLRFPIIVALLIRSVDTIKLYDIIYVLTLGGPGGTTETVSLYVYLVGFRYFRMGYAASLSYLVLAIMVIISTFLLRTMRRREVTA